MRAIRLALLIALALLPFAAAGVTPDEMLRDPKLEARARELSAQLRCMVCQNESIDDSEASLARDIRAIVRTKITAGESDEAIKTFLVQRYGEFILLKPPLKIETVVLWCAPLLLLLAGGTAIYLAVRRRKGAVSTPGLTDAESAKLSALIAEEEK
jgi:cytochrome c-type biogenesis protein CcmH